jgi:hypothetical protein
VSMVKPFPWENYHTNSITKRGNEVTCIMLIG